ncbi:fimbrial protein [Salmonella enterica subsp. enterica]|nr:fimbrial protein [Salmonella enterica]EDV4312671.1 fimbrial protein [Salmonella enterica subsp. enterica]
MKKLNKLALAFTLLGSTVIAHAADLTASATVTTTLVEPANLSATYTAGAPLVSDNLKGQSFGSIALTGYTGTPTITDLDLSDAKESIGYLELQNSNGDSLRAQAFIDGKLIKINGNYGDGPAATGNMPAVKTDIVLKTWEQQVQIPAGEYSDDVTITLSHQ